MRSGVRKKWDALNEKAEAFYRRFSARRDAKLRLRRMNGGFACKKEYREIVVPYWKKYGLKPPRFWYQIFWDRDHRPDPRYIPDDIWYGTVVPYFSNTQFRRCGEDKCMHGVWFPDVKRPRTIAMNAGGVFYDPGFGLISREEALSLCLAEKSFFVKPSIDSGSARLIRFFDESNLSGEALRKVFEELGANFIVQEPVVQHPELARLNESSLNTVRVLSFFFRGEVHILSTILRVGAKGSKVDNIGAGGYACVIGPDGRLNSRGVNRKGEWVETNSEGLAFAGLRVPSFDRVIAEVKRLHVRLPHFKIIGWDFSVDAAGDPVFIEFNSCPGANQITCGPTFGELTDAVLDEIYISRSLQNSQN